MDKEVLFKRKAVDRVEAVDLGDGAIVTVRALSRGEVQTLKDENASAHTFENRLVSAALIDPAMTPSEVAEWLDDAPAGDSAAVAKAVANLSGLAEGAPKSDVDGVPE